MGEFFKIVIHFFHGWRRKIGLVTLVMACVFVAWWGRSLTIADQYTIRMNYNSLFWMISNEGWFGCVVVPETKAAPTTAFFLHRTDRSSGDHNASPFDGVPYYSGNWEVNPHFILPYSAMVIPLSLISLWLLLFKPRKTTQKKITEPIPSEGA
jgi:hypothetical protein